ncbi:hypothetical protein [Pseudomonas abyssi]|uniref:Lipoprotein n=1 Tax=Pseudomonas abyssi TaxID=170540 RepID=A0A395RAD2_9PSED|nr:hypothetical protein [Halopseudomonas gallaeciensis]RGP57077.1 hypothetical protein ASB58_07030 [Halopseudomonas gallaeciensis]
MSKYLFVLALVSCGAFADECATVSVAAMKIMEARQSEVPMAAMMMAADQQDPAYQAVTRELVLSAYDRDLRYSDESKRREITEFGNMAYQACLSVGS